MLDRILHTNLIMLNPLMRAYYRYKYSVQGVVYMLHRVGDLNKNGISYNENLKVSPYWLEYVIKSYRDQGFVFFSVDDLYDVLSGSRKSQKPFVVFTLDDGYVDNYTQAYPIFKKYKVPFCVYVATDFPDGKAFLWWYALEEYLGDLPDKNALFVDLRKKVLSFSKRHFIDEFEKLLPGFEIEPTKYVQSESMTWQQISDMAKDPLCTIGGHTVSHPAFTSLSEIEIRNEIEEGTQILESHTGIPVSHFAYPYGSLKEVNEREYDITEQYDFKTIMTTVAGGITSSTNKKRLNRYMLMDETAF